MKDEVLLLDEKLVDDFWRLRVELLKELGEVCQETDLIPLEAATKQYYLAHINKDLISWGIFQNEKLVAIGSLCLFSRIPYDENLSGLEGYFLNIYTSKQFRGNSFASQILDKIIEYSHKNNIKRLWLSSSVQGRQLYMKKGFAAKNNEMELLL